MELCGCGRPVRHMTPGNEDGGSCNKYQRRPTYEELRATLEIVKTHVGDVECLVEVVDEGACYMVPVDELSFEDREGYGKSIAILQ